MQRFFTLVSLLTAGLLAGCSHTPSGSADQAGMDSIAPNVYVDTQMSAAQRDQLMHNLVHARLQVADFFGSMQSSPEIYACSTKQCFSRFSGIVDAKAKTKDDDKVILSSRALDRVTLAHELTHVEFHKRLGTHHVWHRVPMWFDEGLALLSCGDPDVPPVLEDIALNELHTEEQWLSAIKQNKPAYGVAKQAVERWYERAGSQGLHDLIEKLKQGQDFRTAAGLDRDQGLTSNSADTASTCITDAGCVMKKTR